MRKKFLILFGLLFIGLILILAYRVGKQFLIVDFDSSLQTKKYLNLLDERWGKPIYKTLKQLYEKNSADNLVYHEKPLIPLKIHQIWLGSPLPEEYAHYAQTWKDHHPEWEYHLWTDADLANYPMKNRALYDAARNYGEKSDIARYEILYQEGGLYVDTDYECLKACDVFNHYYTFYTGIQPLDTNIMQLGIGIIGAQKGHPLLKAVIENLVHNSTLTQQIIAKTGPIYFTRVFCSIAPQLHMPLIALPPTYFYPRGYYQSKDEKNIWLKPESYAVHHWAGSWCSPNAFMKE